MEFALFFADDREPATDQCQIRLQKPDLLIMVPQSISEP